MRLLPRYVIIFSLLFCVLAEAGCVSTAPKGDGQENPVIDERSFEALLDRTLDKINDGKAAELTPAEFTAALCFFPIDIRSLRTLCGIEPLPGYYCFGGGDAMTEQIEDAYLRHDLNHHEAAIVRYLLTADIDSMGIVQRVCTRHDISMSFEEESWCEKLDMKERNIVLAAHIADLACIKECNGEFLKIWADGAQHEMVRDLCLGTVLYNCDEASYVFIRDRLLDEGQMEVPEKVNALMQAVHSPTAYSILFPVLARAFEGKFQKEGYEQLLDDLKDNHMADFRIIGKIFGDKGILAFWIVNRDYLRRENSWLNTWQLDVRQKAADVLGGDVDPASLSQQQLRKARTLFDEFDSKRLQERIGLTQRQMRFIPLEKLLLWDRLSAEEKDEALRRIPGRAAQTNPRLLFPKLEPQP